MKRRRMRVLKTIGFAGALLAAASASALAQKKYDAGVTDSEIKIGNTMPYSGPASSLGIIGRSPLPPFQDGRRSGGINGRKITFISYDDAYSPPKTVEQTRGWSRATRFFSIFAARPGNQCRNPEIFQSQGGTPAICRLGHDPPGATPNISPWTIGLQPSYRSEARIYATFILQNHPGQTIGILYQNDDFGKDYILGLKDVLRDQYPGRLVVSGFRFEISASTVDSQVASIKSANPGVFINSSPKFAAQAIKKVAEIDSQPVDIMTTISTSPAPC